MRIGERTGEIREAEWDSNEVFPRRRRSGVDQYKDKESKTAVWCFQRHHAQDTSDRTQQVRENNYLH